jgi:hypothetical protein
MNEQDFQDFIKNELEKLNVKIDKQFEKYDITTKDVIGHGIKIDILWKFIFSGLSITAILNILIVVLFKFVIK